MIQPHDGKACGDVYRAAKPAGVSARSPGHPQEPAALAYVICAGSLGAALSSTGLP